MNCKRCGCELEEWETNKHRFEGDAYCERCYYLAIGENLDRTIEDVLLYYNKEDLKELMRRKFKQWQWLQRYLKTTITPYR